MKNLHTVELRLNAENHIVDRKDLSIDPDMQMRTAMSQETIDQYAGSITAILEEKPIDVIAVEGHLETRWLVVDGFHRYHAAVQAEVDAINIRLMKGTYDDAVQYAMSANWENGLRPKAEDAARSINMLLKTAPDFGYDSKAANKWVTSFGIPKSTAENHTSSKIAEIKEALHNAARPLYLNNMSLRKASEELGVGVAVVRGVYDKFKEEAVLKTPEVQTTQETPNSESSPFPADEPFFNEEELDATPALNPADAFQKALSEHEEERTHQQQDKTDVSIASSDVPKNVNETKDDSEYSIWKNSISTYLANCGVFEDLTKAEVSNLLTEIAQGK